MVTVKQILLRQADEFASPNVFCTLERTSRGEGPARTAGSLILDRRHGTKSNPRNGKNTSMSANR